MRLNSLRARMTAAFAFAFAALTLLFVGILLWFLRHEAESRADSALQAAVRSIQSEYVTRAQIANPGEWDDVKEELARDNLALVVVDAKGHVIRKTAGNVPLWSNLGRQDWRVRKVELDGGIAVVGFYWKTTEHALRLQEGALLGFSVLLFASATLCAWILVKRTLTPMFRLSQQADTASMDNLRLRLYAPSQDAEIVHLVQTLNGLLGRVSEAMAARGRFYAAASHELRTPLQTLTGYLDVALMQRRAAEEYEEILKEASLQTVRLTSLIQALLLLNQVDASALPRQETVDLAEVCDRWLSHFHTTVAGRNLRVEARLPESAPIQAAPSYVEILIRNVLDNAFKYADRESLVYVSLEASREEIRLTICNACTGLPEWDEARLFEPFYRPDASRNSETGGNGLGLAICKAIADASGWRIGLARKTNGVQTEVLFPNSR